MFTLPTLTFPSYSLASSSRIGAIILQGPHHSAQKSTSTGVGEFSTSCSKLASVNMTIFRAAITRQSAWRIDTIVEVVGKLQHQHPNEHQHADERRGDG